MSNYEQMKKIEKVIVCSIIAFVAVFVVVVYSFIVLGNARQRNAEQEALIASLSEKKYNLENDINSLSSSKEELFRERLGMLKENENVYVYEK